MCSWRDCNTVTEMSFAGFADKDKANGMKRFPKSDTAIQTTQLVNCTTSDGSEVPP